MVLFSDNSKFFLGNAWWKDDKTLLVNTWYPSDRDTWIGFRQVRFTTREVRLLIINTETGEVTSPFKKSFLRKYKILPNNLGTVVDSLYRDPDHILMSIPSMDRKYPSYEMVVKVNINNKRKKVIEKPQTHVSGLRADQNHSIRLSSRFDEGRVTNRIKDDKTGVWRELWPYDVFSGDEVNILGFGNDPNVVYISAYHNDYKAVFKVDLRDESLARELVFSDPSSDVSGHLIHAKKDGRVLAVGSKNEEGRHFIDPVFKTLQASIDKALPDSRNNIYSITENENKYIVYSSGTKESGTYYLGTRNPVTLNAISYVYKELPPDRLADVQQIEYTTRDGLDIEAYLTLPKGVPPKQLPTLMFPHGGPIARDEKSFDYWAQFFASRGYAVLQMNFRGSSGQGLEFRNSGLKKWGKEMQDDIEDGAIDLIEKGIADPNRICIVGASYGGYAALMGVVKTPARYKCAISVNGVSNVFDLVKDNRAFWRNYNVVDEMIGNDNANLRAISPVNNVKVIKAPVLLIHGVLDRQVDIKHSRQMHKELVAEDKSVEFIEMEGEDHYLSNEFMRVKAFKAMGKFLDTHLPINASQ